MARLNQDQVRALLQVLEGTRERELTCDECLPYLAVLVEYELAGESPPEALALVHEHLAICPECVEELNILREAMKGLESDRSSAE